MTLQQSEDTYFSEPLLITVEEGARLCNLSRALFYRMIMKGEIPSVTIGRARRIPLGSLREWVSEQTARQRHG